MHLPRTHRREVARMGLRPSLSCPSISDANIAYKGWGRTVYVILYSSKSERWDSRSEMNI